MIVALRGKLVKSSPLYAVLDVGGVYYGVNVPITTAERLPRAGEETLLHTLAVYREDSQTLYGFATEGDRDFFAILVEKVSGIGPKIALNMLSRMSVQSLKSAIAAGDVSLLSKCPGIGRKTAERLVLELRGVLGAAGVGETLAAAESAGGGSSANVSDALAALVALGVKPADADKSVRGALAKLGADASAEDLIKHSLLSR